MYEPEADRRISTPDHDILFLPGRGRLQKLRDNIRSFFMASFTNPSAQKYLRSRTAILSEKRRHIRNYKYNIHPFSNFRYYWDILMILTITAILITIPYQAAFRIIPEKLSLTILKNCLLLVCWADVFMNLSTGYFDKGESLVQMEHKKIMKRYARHGTLFPDLLGSFPTDVIFLRIWNEYVVARKVASLVCAFRFFSMCTYVNKVAYELEAPLWIYHISKIIFYLFILIHWLACIFWLVPIATTSMKLPLYPRNDSWIHESNVWESTKDVQYFYSLVQTIGNFYRSGFLKNDRRNTADLYVVIIVQITGILTFWILIAKIMEYFKGTNSSELRFEGAVAQLKQYMRHKQLPRRTQRRIIDYYEFRFQHRYFREPDILNTLSSQIRQEIGLHSCRKLVENVTFFNNLPFSLLNRIVALLKSEIFLTNDVIVRANDPGDCMYFIGSGTVAIYTISGKEVCHLEDGAYFGEIALVMADERRVASVVAVEICELYRLDRADFARTIHPYPMLWDRIKKIAIERHEKTMILSAQ